MAVTPVGNMDTCKNTVMFWKARLSQGRLGNIVSTMDVILVGDMDILIDFVMNESTISRRLGVKTNVMLSQKAIVRRCVNTEAVRGVQRENSDVSKLNKILGVEHIGKLGC
ncbi:hypothetical protein F2Q70_00020385 [Brassica cretica]|uniref:Uncharacterized protein n=1 Tax=Brassica cretica TaxID=69181 RepID=A0A3N6RB77_BRACR|nr:hypothetical protein F2Q70_00020385 [Brassica cretica]KAF3605408.1 hypothetical protein DY000_02046231 [Brassica cretica]